MIMVKFKQKMIRKMNSKLLHYRQGIFALSIASVLVLGMALPAVVTADEFDEQIKKIQADNNINKENVKRLQVQADSYQGEIDRLQAQIDAVRAQIRENEAKRDDLQKQITAAEEELARQKVLLGENIKAVYVEGQISTLEMLASSKNLSEFLDKQQYRDTIQQKIKDTLDKINALKAQLKEQKDQVEKLLQDQQAMNSQLSSAQTEQNALLNFTTAQKNQFTAQIKSNNKAIAELRAQQLAANRRLGGTAEPGDPNHGNYPAYLDRAPKDALVDPWGMYNRECVSYTAWKVYETFGHMPYWGGHGNANEWPQSARNDGIPTGSTPRENSVAVSMRGFYGHVMWVEAVLSNGYIRVSQYNYDLAGHYSEMTIKGDGLIYIYFQ